MTEGVFIEYDQVKTLSDGAMVGKVRYRKRPADSGCGHPRVAYHKRGAGVVDVICTCGACWYEVKVTDVHFSERAELYLAEAEARLLEEELRLEEPRAVKGSK